MSKAQTFARMVRENGPLPVGLASDCARQACLGLQHIHEKRLVHRDIKPSNLMLDRNGVVKILDLGLARIRHLDPISGTMSFLTEIGGPIALGTPYYCSPEQWLDPHNVDTRSDIYSLGCALYHLLAGAPPFYEFKGDLWAIRAAQMNEEPRAIESLRTDIPAQLGIVLRRIMSRNVEARFQVPSEVSSALEPFCSQIGDNLYEILRDRPLEGLGAMPTKSSPRHSSQPTSEQRAQEYSAAFELWKQCAYETSTASRVLEVAVRYLYDRRRIKRAKRGSIPRPCTGRVRIPIRRGGRHRTTIRRASKPDSCGTDS